MEGPKRLQFTTVGPPGKDDKKKPSVSTTRFELDLSESNEKTCPEFFYSDLVKTLPGTENKSTSEDPFGDDDADAERLLAIAKAFEDKYNKPEGKKKKKKKWRDNMEYDTGLGDGYDETDTFIDNSEAYDEVMPGRVTTKLGGFYINSGKLEFSEVSDDSEDDFQPGSVKKNKKRRISSDDDSDTEKKVIKKKKLKDGLALDGEVKKKKKKKIFPLDGEKPFKKPKQPHDKDKLKQNKSSTVAALLKSTSPNLNGEEVENGILSSPESGDSNEASSSLKSNISMTIDSVISMATKDDSNSREYEDSKKEIDPESIPKLPVSMPSGMEARIDELKRHAKESRDGKCKFFAANVNKILLEVEMSSKQMPVSNRSAMYGHLAAFLPCSKDTLLKRAKTLLVKDLEDRIKEPLEKLRTAINRIMPGLQEKYEADCQKVAQEKSEEVNKEEQEKDTKEDMATESDEEEKTNQSETTKKRQTGPRKKFVWDNNVRSLLCDVVRVKMHTYQMSKARAQTADEYCKAFLDADVRPIWPKGWMQTRVLYKESKSAHSNWTNPQKPKKAMLVNKTPTSVVGTSQTVKPVNPSSAPAGMNLSKVGGAGVTKVDLGMAISKSVNVSKTSPVNINSSKSAANNHNTPNAPAKKIVPTLLDYTSSNSGLTTTSSVLPVSKPLSQSGLMKSLLSPTQLKPDAGTNKQNKNSWDHIVSDILRSSITDPFSGKSPPQQTVTQLQRSNSIQSETSFYAQFEKYAKLPPSQGQGQEVQKQTSPNQSASTGQLALANQQQKLLQQQALRQQIEKREQLKRDQQKREQLQKQEQLKRDQQPTQEQIKREQQLKLLQEQTRMLHEKQKQLQQQQVAKQLAASMAKSNINPPGQKVKVAPNQSGQNMQMLNKQSGQRIQLTNIQSGQKLQISGAQSKQPPSQSPMSIAMNRNASVNQAGQKLTPKQLVNQFSTSSSPGMSVITEKVIRQQLSDTQVGSVTKPSLQGKIVHKSGHVRTLSSQGQIGDHFGQVSSSTDSLRKSSPQSQASAASLPSSQGRTSTPHVIKVQSSQGQASQGHTVYNPTTITVTTNGKPATNLLKSFIGQAQKFTSVHDSTNQQRLLQGGTGGSSVQGSTNQPQWSPTSMKSNQQQGRPTYPGAGDAQPKPYTMPSTTSPRPVPGYQSVRLSSLTGEQLAAYQAVQQQHRSPETASIFSNPLGQRTTPGSPSFHLSPEQHRYNALHYGYHGYKDSTK